MSLRENVNTVPGIEIDIDLLVFVERYVTNLLKWDMLTYFGSHPDETQSVPEIADKIGRSHNVIRSELGDLAMLGLLDMSNGSNPAKYQLTSDIVLRSQVIRFAQKKTYVA